MAAGPVSVGPARREPVRREQYFHIIIEERKGEPMKKFIIIFLIGFVLMRSMEGAILLTCSAAMIYAVMWVLQKLGVLSAPRRMSNAAGNEVRRAYNRSVVMDLLRRYLH